LRLLETGERQLLRTAVTSPDDGFHARLALRERGRRDAWRIVADHDREAHDRNREQCSDGKEDLLLERHGVLPDDDRADYPSGNRPKRVRCDERRFSGGVRRHWP